MKSFRNFIILSLAFISANVFLTSCLHINCLPPPAYLIDGEYFGTGSLQIISLNVNVESYPGMKVKVERSSNEYVIVTPYNADGTPFLSSGDGTVYKVSRLTTGEFLLTNTEEVPMAEIKISSRKEMSYYYPYVSVADESGYALKFTGKRQL